MKQLGAKVVLTEKAPFTDQKNYIQLSKRIAKEKKVNGSIKFKNLEKRIAVTPIPQKGIGKTINERLRRASFNE